MAERNSQTAASDDWRSLYPFCSHYLPLPAGPRLHYLDEGSGRPLLFVHGNPTWSFYWRNLVSGLSDQWRCVAVDHVGCGLSDKPQKLRLLPVATCREPGRPGRKVGLARGDARGPRLGGSDWIGGGYATPRAVLPGGAVQHGRLSALSLCRGGLRPAARQFWEPSQCEG
jgi:pimeloyl-ACP methyl ester carboxylesterase